MVRCVEGTARLDALPFLQSWVARLRFPPATERWVDARHSLLKQPLAHASHFTAAYVALKGATPFMRDVLNHSPDMLATLAMHCSETRKPRLVVANMGMRGHPTLQRLAAADGNSQSLFHRKWRKDVLQVICHCDDTTLYTHLPDAPAADDRGPPPPPPGGPSSSSAPPSASPPTPPASSPAPEAPARAHPGSLGKVHDR